MKKIIICFAMCIFLFAAFILHASVDVVLFNGTFTRTIGSPVAFERSFPGVQGPATIYLTNEQISSAVITVNGLPVFGTSDFSQNVSSLTKTVELIQGNNTISVLLQSKPAGKIKIQIVQQMECEAAQVISPVGGVVEVTNTNSPLYGVKVEVPEGTFLNSNIISISMTSDSISLLKPLPDSFIPDGSSITFKSLEGTFQKPVLIYLPFSGNRAEDEARVVFTFNEARSEWQLVMPIPNPDPNVFIAMTNHFSDYVKTKTTITDNEIVTPFQLDWDTLNYQNDGSYECKNDPQKGGICAGMAHIATQYFNDWPQRDTEGLKCRWDAEHSAQTSCEAHGLYIENWKRIIDKIGSYFRAGIPLDYWFILDAIKGSLKTGKAITVGMIYHPLRSDEIGHAVVAYGWRKTSTLCGEIDIYNVNSNSSKEKITYCGPIIQMYYISPSGNKVRVFFTDNTTEKSSTDAIINKYPSDHLCSLPLPIAKFWVYGCEEDWDNPHCLSFWGDTYGYPVSYNWNFGDGTKAYGYYVEHTFKDNAGPYDVNLTVVRDGKPIAARTLSFCHPISYTITGRVTTSLGSPLPGATMVLSGGDMQHPAIIKNTTTDNNGNYRLTNIPAGKMYWWWPVLAGYEITSYTGMLFDGYGFCYAGSIIEESDFTMQRRLVIAMEPPAGPPGTTFKEWGTGFTPNTTATLHFRKPDGSEFPTRTEKIDSNGHFEITYTAPKSLPLGTYTWWAIDADGNQSNSVNYTITPLPVPTIAMWPMSGPPGVTLTEWGTGFTPNTTATLHFRKPNGTEYPTRKVDIDSGGHFEITYTTPMSIAPGTYTWWAVDKNGTKSNEVKYVITQ